MPTYKKANSCLNCPYQSGAFSFLSTNEKESIQKNCLIAKFKKGENVIKQGQKPDNAIYISQGLVKVFMESEKRNIILKLAKGGEYTALSTIFNKSPYTYSISAIEDSRICIVNAELFKYLAQKNMDFMHALTEEMAGEANFILKRLIFLNQKNAKARLAEILLFLSEKIYKKDNFKLTLTREELGEMISISRENTGRMLSELQKEGLIAINGKNINIIDKKMLTTLKNIG
jgi:CRP/FNR family transcriptional regulator